MKGKNKMNVLKKALSIVLAVIMLFSVVPLATITVKANSNVTLEALQKKYPHGKYWNGGNANSYTSTPCTHHGSCSYSGTCGCNTFKGHAIQCMGFAYQLAYLIYGGDPYVDWTVNRNVSALNTLKAGDVVRYKNDGHSIFVTDVTGDTVTYADCNSDGHCKIRWGQTISKSTLKSTFTYVDSAPYKWEGVVQTHKVNSSFGTNFTAYPKSKITAVNIFDANHNQISSSAWIGTSDKCTIHEVYTDGCCKVSYPLESGGTKTVYSKISLFNTHTHNYTGTRVYETKHPHAITQRCVNYASCGGYKVTGEYAQVKECKQCWYTSFDLSTPAVSLKVGESKTISATINGFWPDTMVGVFDYDKSRIEVTTGQNAITFKGLKAGNCTLKLILYSDNTKSYVIGSKSISVTVSEPTYTGKVLFDKSSMALTIPTKQTDTMSVSLSGNWPENAGYIFEYDSNYISYTQDGPTVTITAKKAGTTNFTIFIVDKDNNNKKITSATCKIVISNATYTVKYDANGGSGGPHNQTKTYGVTMPVSSVEPTRSGYEFLGWSRNKNSTAPEYRPGDSFTINANTTLYAVWEKITLTSIGILDYPTKKTYSTGESLDTSGLKLQLRYSDGTTNIVTSGFTTSGFSSVTAGIKTVTVKYSGLTTTFTVTVNEPEPDIDENAPQIILGNKKVTVGKEFTVAVELKNNPGFNAASIKIEYDNNKLQLLNAELREAFSTGANVSYDNLPYLTFIRSNDVSDDAEFLILSFRALDVGDVKLSIGYEEGDISNSKEEDVNFIVVGGDITIAQYTPGDINDDGKVNTKDLTRLLKYINHEDVECNEQALDVNGDGKVNTKDLTRLLRYINRENVEIF